jgi:hypothetical protein
MCSRWYKLVTPHHRSFQSRFSYFSHQRKARTALRELANQPRPTSGIFVAISVMN